MPSTPRALLVTALLLLTAAAHAAPLSDPDAIPQLGADGRDAYREFLAAAPHRAFAIAPGGAFGWKAGADSAASATEWALAACRGETHQKCVPYATDDRVVFDVQAWPLLWGPYKTAAEAERTDVGRAAGERFANLAFTDAAGRPTTLGALRGKVVVLHLWGSWCAPCRREMPQLQKLYDSLRSRNDVAFVLLQAREPIAVSKRWAQQQRFHLPLADSGSRGDQDAGFALAGGARIADRQIATVFPTTYVIDRHGVVVFAHTGPVEGWPQYEPFILDAVRRSGK